MKTYNKTLDYVALSLQQLRAGKPQLAARLLAKAGAQSDVSAAIRVIEVSNAHAFNLAKIEASGKKPVKAAKRLKADAEDPGEVGIDTDGDGEVDFDIDADPLDEISDDGDEEDAEDEEEEEPVAAMAKVLSSMVRKP